MLGLHLFSFLFFLFSWCHRQLRFRPSPAGGSIAAGSGRNLAGAEARPDRDWIGDEREEPEQRAPQWLEPRFREIKWLFDGGIYKIILRRGPGCLPSSCLAVTLQETWVSHVLRHRRSWDGRCVAGSLSQKLGSPQQHLLCTWGVCWSLC